MANKNLIYENVENSSYKQRHPPAPTSLQTTQKQVDELVEIVYENVDQVLQRKEILEDLNVKSENLEECAVGFKTSANEIKRKKWKKHMRTKLISIGIIVLFVIGLIVLLVYLL